MARAARKARDDDAGEVKTKDFGKARKLYFEDIKPARSKASEHMQEVSTGFKAVKKECHIQPGAMKAAIKFVETEDAKGDDWMRCFVGLVNDLKGTTVLTYHSNDLVDMAEREDGYKRPPISLVTIGTPSDGSETDLADAADAAGDDFEASEEELAQQEGRGASGD